MASIVNDGGVTIIGNEIADDGSQTLHHHPRTTHSLRTNEEAVALAKLLVPNPVHRIRLHDLVNDQLDSLSDHLGSDKFNIATAINTDELHEVLKAYETATSQLLSIISVISFHGTDEQAELVDMAICRLINRENHSNQWKQLIDYPALLVSYVAGACSVAGNQHRILARVLGGTHRYDANYQYISPTAEATNTNIVFCNLQDIMRPHDRRRAEVRASDYMAEVVKSYLKTFVSIDGQVNVSFDIFEYLTTLVRFARAQDGAVPIGRYVVDYSSYGDRSPIEAYVNQVVHSDGMHPLLQAGLFDGSSKQLEQTRDEFWQRLRGR